MLESRKKQVTNALKDYNMFKLSIYILYFFFTISSIRLEIA